MITRNQTAMPRAEARGSVQARGLEAGVDAASSSGRTVQEQQASAVLGSDYSASGLVTLLDDFEVSQFASAVGCVSEGVK